MVFFRNVLAVIIGLMAGSLVNMALVTLGPKLIAPPPGMNVQDAKSIADHAHLMEPKHFLFPFLAHAVGSFVGALVAFKMARSLHAAFAYVVGVLFLAGGIAACLMIPAPTWFIALDLLVAYLPMAWLATRVGSAPKSS